MNTNSNTNTTIWGFSLELTDRQIIMIPKGARMLCAQFQRSVCVWAEVNSSAPPETVEFLIVGTGKDGPDFREHTYLSTVQMGSLVWHVYYR